MSFFILEGLKWPAIILSIALAHIHHVRAMVNAVNVLHITAEWGSTGMFLLQSRGKTYDRSIENLYADYKKA